MAAERWGAPPDEPYLKAVSALFARSGRDKPVDLLRWQYLNGVAGPATVCGYDTADGALGAHYATVPRSLWIHGRVHPAAQSIDVMTREEWRDRGLYLRLAKRAYGRLQQAGTELVFGFPNETAAPGFFGPLQWEPLGAVPLVARPLLLGAVAGRVPALRSSRLAHGSIVEVPEVPEEVEELWKRFSPQLRVAVVRDYRFLRWRIDERPGVDYVRLAAYERGSLVAFTTVGVAHRFGRRVGQILELLVDPAHDARGGALLRAAIGVARRRGCVAVLGWVPRTSPVGHHFHRAGFGRVPRAVMPVELFSGLRIFDRRDTALLDCLDPSAWYFSYLDSDTV